MIVIDVLKVWLFKGRCLKGMIVVDVLKVWLL